MISPDQLDLAYSAGTAVCAILAVANLARYKTRGAAAIFMGSACISLGFTIWMAKTNSSSVWLAAGVVVTGILLLVEFGIRSAKQGSSR